MSRFGIILAAAGSSSRFNDPAYKKPFAKLNQKAVWLHSAELFLKRDDVHQLVLVISADDQEDFMSMFGPNIAVMGIDVVIGGKERADSVQNGLDKIKNDIDFVVIHDAARPCLHDEFVESIFGAARQHGSAVPAIPVNSTVKRSDDGNSIKETVDRTHLYLAQTPQVFPREAMIEAFRNRGQQQPTDEAQLMELAGHQIRMVQGSPLNIKITTRADLRLAGACLKALPQPKFDAPIHPFADDNLWR